MSDSFTTSTYGSSYYYNDPTTQICYYYACFPRPYSCGSGYGSSLEHRGGSNSCDYSDSDNDSDNLGGIDCDFSHYYGNRTSNIGPSNNNCSWYCNS